MNKVELDIVNDALSRLYMRRIEKINDIDIFKIIKHKNPYMYKAFGSNDAHGFVENILSDCQTSSDETIFGTFFEDIAIAVAKNGRKSSANSIDLEIWSDDNKSVTLYAIKSGTKVFNAQSIERQRQAFSEALRRLVGTAVIPKVGFAYGKISSSSKQNKNNFEKEAGQIFWENISGDTNFYIKLIDAIGEVSEPHRQKFQEEWLKCINKQYKKFLDVFGNSDGSIDWKSIVQFVSSKDRTTEINKKINKAKKEG